MKIKCEYCGSMFDDTLEKCPNCGGTNNNVRRSTSDQPTTIEELKEWYVSKGLPDEEVTRFFIGRDYKGSKAFGIYKNAKGKFIVYKNKADGSRAVRYEGTDEAYAVNELLTRLRQEILEQKGRAVKNAAASANKSVPVNKPVSSQASSSKSSPASSSVSDEKKTVSPEEGKKALLTLLIAFVVIIAIVAGIAAINQIKDRLSRPLKGYYEHNGELFYHCDETVLYWAKYDRETNDWKLYDRFWEVDWELQERKTAKQYYLGEVYDSSFGGYDFADSLAYEDYQHGNTVAKGYYDVDDTVYYHNSYDKNEEWYYFDTDDNDWMVLPDDMLPTDLTHGSLADDFWYTPEWDSETQLTDFEDSAIYQEYIDRYNTPEEEDDSWWGTNDDSSDDYDWDWGSNNWDSGSTDWNSNW